LESFEEALGVKEGMTTDDGLFTLQKAGCSGSCFESPVVRIGGEPFGNMGREKAKELLRMLMEKHAAEEGAGGRDAEKAPEASGASDAPRSSGASSDAASAKVPFSPKSPETSREQ
jgi:hypothetical protein